MMFPNRLLCTLTYAVVSFALLTSGKLALGQPAAQGTANKEPNTITLQQKVEPSFRIEPVVHRFRANRGQVVPFEFLMTSTGREMEVEMKVVELRQEENGTILHKEDGKPAAGVTFTSPINFNLNAGDSRKITGEVTVPATRSNFHSFGILVRDKGQAPKFASIDKAKNAVQAGVHFVTQYILRCDIEIDGSNENEMGQVKLRDGGFRVHNGLPAARVWLENPTNNAFEFQVRGALQLDNSSTRPEMLQLGMASRSSLPEPDKYLIRIMPQSRLLLESPVTTALIPGPVQLTFAVHNGRREVVHEKFTTQIAADNFPALAVAAVRVNEAVVVSPGQILLSQLKGGQRTVSVKLLNSSEESQRVQLQIRDLEGNELPSVRVSPESVQLSGKRSQNVRLTLRSQKDTKEPQFGYLHVSATTSDNNGVATTARVPMSIFFAPSAAPDMEFASLETISQQGQTAFRVIATNHEGGFTPINAELDINNDQGQRIELSAGFNKWIAPRDSLALLFRPETQIPPGRYQATLRLHTFENCPPKVLTTEFTLQPSDEPSAKVQ